MADEDEKTQEQVNESEGEKIEQTEKHEEETEKEVASADVIVSFLMDELALTDVAIAGLQAEIDKLKEKPKEPDKAGDDIPKVDEEALKAAKETSNKPASKRKASWW